MAKFDEQSKGGGAGGPGGGGAKQRHMRRRATLENAYDIDLSSYSHPNTDRFAVLMDAWTNEVNFMEMKKALLDVYYEAYQHTFDRQERRQLAQCLVDLMRKRVRFDLDASYFTLSYRLEISCMFKQTRAVKFILERMVRVHF